jgi:CubicO group peptidase (beta-lactamase class C family)
MTEDLLADFVRADRDQNLGTYGIHLHREGHPPVEHRFRSDDRVNLYSVAKTFTAVALGLAESEGRLTLDDRLLDHMPELRSLAADGFADVTLRHLITMTSGTSHRWFAHEPIHAADLLHEIVAAPVTTTPVTVTPITSTPVTATPVTATPVTATPVTVTPITATPPADGGGARFAYTGSGPYAVGRVIARVTGADLRAYLMPRLFRPLGLHNPQWHTCPLGHPFAESDLYLRTSELARFARLLLQEGIWEDRRLIPADFVRRMVSDHVSSSSRTLGHRYTHGYGLGVWLDCADRYRMDGAYGQFAVIAPAQRAAVTVTAHSERDGALLDALHDLVLDRLP